MIAAVSHDRHVAVEALRAVILTVAVAALILVALPAAVIAAGA